LIACGWFDRWPDRIWANDPEGGTQNPPIVRVPNGALLDQVYWSVWRAGLQSVRNSRTSVDRPREWDCESPKYMARNLFELLVDARS
jgi:hypothetical protein